MSTRNEYLSIPFTLSACVMEASLSLVGMLRSLHSIPGLNGLAIPVLAGLSAEAAVSIEGEVFHTNIKLGVKRFFENDALLHRRLRLLIANTINNCIDKQRIPNLDFLIKYQQYFLSLNALKENHYHGHDEVMKEKEAQRKRDIATIEQKLYWMENSLYYFLLGDEHHAILTKETKESLAIFKWKGYEMGKPAPFLAELSRKKNWMNFWHGVNVASFLGTFLSSLFASNQFFIFFGVTLTASTGGMALLVGLALISAAAYSIMMYNTYHEIISFDLCQSTFRKSRLAWKNGGWKSRASLILSLIFFAGVFSLVTLGTLGTWWVSGIGGQALLFKVSSHLGGLFVGVAIGVFSASYALINALFNIKNSFDTILRFFNTKEVAPLDENQESQENLALINEPKQSKFSKLCDNAIDYCTQPFMDIFDENDSLFQRHYYNPAVWLLAGVGCILQTVVRLTYAVVRAFDFIWHLVSEGATTDSAFSIPAIPVNVAGAFGEGTADAGYVFDKEKSSANPASNQLQRMQLDGDPPHSHLNVVSKIFVAALTITMVLPICCFLHKVLTGETWQQSWKKNVSDYWHGGSHHHANKDVVMPEDDLNVNKQQSLSRIKEKSVEYAKKSATKSSFFDGAFRDLKRGSEVDWRARDDAGKLSDHRTRFFNHKPTKSTVFWNEMSETLAAAAA